jgi:SAM-dependent methyltransferase
VTDPSTEHESAHLRARATALADMLDTATIARLEAFSVGPGWRALEVGAGSGSIAAWLCERVGADGHVVAVDLHPELLDHLQYANLEARYHDVNGDDELPGPFDLIHARYMLHWLPDPGQVLKRLARSLAPRGVLFVEEPDFVTLVHGSRSEALSRVISAGAALGASLTGADNFYGRQLPAQLGEVGLTDTGSEGWVGMLRGAVPESGTEWLRLCVEWIAPPALQRETATQEDVDEVFARLADPAFVTPAPITVAAWGRRQ